MWLRGIEGGKEGGRGRGRGRGKGKERGRERGRERERKRGRGRGSGRERERLTSTLGVYHSLRDLLSVEVSHLIQVDRVLHQLWPPGARSDDLGLIINGDSLTCGESTRTSFGLHKVDLKH